MYRRIFTIALLFNLMLLYAQPNPDKKVIYKVVDSTELSLHLFFPEAHHKNKKAPAILFFHGGGWRGGGISHFYNQSAYLASRGLVAINVQYRTEQGHGTSPKECVKDGKSAMRWVKTHASRYGIDLDQIIAGGGSAGGHIAAALATVKGFNEEGEDLSVSCIPKALVLFNPVANNSEEGYGYDRVKDYWKEFSPFHNISKNTPPTLIMLGTKDNLFKPALAEQFKKRMENLGNRCDLILYKDQVHAFFNIDINKEMHFQTMKDSDAFLTSLGYLKGKPTVDQFIKTHNEQN